MPVGPHRPPRHDPPSHPTWIHGFAHLCNRPCGRLHKCAKPCIQVGWLGGSCILRYLSSSPDDSFDVESLMQTFGRLRLDVENCVRELVDFGVATAIPGTPPRFSIARPTSEALIDQLDH